MTDPAAACEACGECVKACPEKAIELRRVGG
ncbi:MAG: 4Fe-4S binding protein [Myxococcales bacterium]|nr:4Fe-4S binding protein [Myxococcales bacterium]